MGHDKCRAVSCSAKLDPTEQAKHRKDSPKTRAAELCKTWTELCMRESRARIRNQQLLQDFSGLEAQLACLAAKTDALRRRKRDYEEFPRHLYLQGYQGPPMPQGCISDKPLELRARPPSATWSELQPLFQSGSHSKELPFAPIELAPAEGAHGKLGPGFGKHKRGHRYWLHPSHSTNFCSQTSSERGSWALLSQYSPQRSQKVKTAWLSPGQGGRLPASFQTQGVPRKAAMLRGGLPQGWLRPGVAQAPKEQVAADSDTSTAGDAANGKKSRGANWTPVLCSGGSEKEQPDMLVRSKGSSLICGPRGTLIPGGASALQGPPGLPHSYSNDDDDVAGSSISSSAEVDSGHWVAERALEVLPRQAGMKAKHGDASMKILNEGCAQISSERLPGLPQHEEILIIQGSRETLGQGRTSSREEAGDGDLGEKGEWEIRGSGDDKVEEREECPGFGPEQAAGECGVQEEEGCVVGGLREGVEELRLGQEEEDGSSVGDGESSAGEGNEFDSLEQIQENLAGDCIDGKGEAGSRIGALEGSRREGERGLEGSVEGKGRLGEYKDKTDGVQEGQNEDGGDEEWSPGSQEGPQGLEDDAESPSSSSVQIPNHGPSEQDNVGGSQNPNLQNESSPAASLMQAGAESVCGEEVEESEADTDVEAALAPLSSKPESRDQQRGATVRRLQELWASSEEPSKDDDVQQDEDDFYD